MIRLFLICNDSSYKGYLLDRKTLAFSVKANSLHSLERYSIAIMESFMALSTLKDINWNHLYCFYEVAKRQSLKEASQSLGLASSTLSEQLKKLENKIGKTLFIRSSKGLMLSKEGEVIFEHAKEIFEAGSKLLDTVSNSEVGGYPVNVGIEETLSHDIATEFTSQYWDLFAPFGTVNTYRESEHDTLVDNLFHGLIDWGISVKEPRRKSLDYAKIGDFNIVFCCSSDLYNRFIDAKDILRNIPLARSSWDHGVHKTLDLFLKEYDITPKEFIKSDHFDYIKKLCQRGRCVFYTAENPLNDYGGLETFQVGGPIKVNLYAIWRKQNENMISIKKLRELIQFKLSQLPSRYDDYNLQIEMSEVSDELLK